MADIDGLVRSVYCPPRNPGVSWQLERLVGHDRIRYFSHGRHALAATLGIAGVGRGDHVLMPSFICRELLAAVHSVGAAAIFYQVDKNLGLADDPRGLPTAGAILAVDYFGFPQSLAPFQDYCVRTGAVLIEDNAHGLFSRDEGGRALGTRAPLGIFSQRKSLALPDGAALVLNRPAEIQFPLPPQIGFRTGGNTFSFALKQALRKTVPVIGPEVLADLIALRRLLRKMSTGTEIPSSAPESEVLLPGNGAPCRDLAKLMGNTEVQAEINRRRNLYLWLDPKLRSMGGEPIYSSLPEQVVPYCFPFFADARQISRIRAELKRLHLGCFPWPDLPAAVRAQAPEWYSQVWNVQFLW